MKIKIPSIRKKKSLFLDENGKPKTIVYTGKRTSSFTSKDTGRSIQKLKNYWKYYKGEGTVFAAINTISFNTIMVGYSLISSNEEAKTFIQDLFEEINLLDVLLKATRYSLIFGDAFIEKRRNRAGIITSLFCVDPKTMIINYNQYGEVESYQQVINGKKLDTVIDPKDIIHIRFLDNPDSPYGLSILEPNEDTIIRKVRTDEALFNAIQRHGTSKIVAYVGNEKEGTIPPEEVLEEIQKKLEDVTEINDFVVPWMIKIESLDEKGVQGVEEYFDLFQTQLIVGLMCPEEALGLGKGSTEACNDEKTQILTKNGWKYYWELNDNDLIATYNPNTGELEYHKPLEPVDKYVYDHDGPMIKFKTQKVDMLVTPNHRIFACKNHTATKNKWQIYEASSLLDSGSRYALKNKVKGVNGLSIELDDFEKKIVSASSLELFLKFIGYFISEGSITGNNLVRISQKKEDISRDIEFVISQLPFEYKKYYNKEKGYTWAIYDGELLQYLKKYGDNCYDRRIKRNILNLPTEYLKILLEAALNSDGTGDRRKNRHTLEYSTTSKHLADDIQEIAFKCGYRTMIHKQEDKRQNRKLLYRVRLDYGHRDYVTVEPKRNSVSTVYYKGKVFSLNVPNHIYVTRRNGKIAIQGNTASQKAILYERMIRSFQVKIEEVINKELINEQLLIAGFTRENDRTKPVSVKIRFNTVTDEDEAMKAKWLGNLLRGFPDGPQPFSINEIRSFFSLPPREGMDELYIRNRKKGDNNGSKGEDL